MPSAGTAWISRNPWADFYPLFHFMRKITLALPSPVVYPADGYLRRPMQTAHTHTLTMTEAANAAADWSYWIGADVLVPADDRSGGGIALVGRHAR
jgi:hypothetical protein